MSSIRENWLRPNADDTNPIMHRFGVRFRLNGDWHVTVQRAGGPIEELYQDALHVHLLQDVLERGVSPSQLQKDDDPHQKKVRAAWDHTGADLVTPIVHFLNVQIRANGDWFCEVQRSGGPVEELYQDLLHIEQLQNIIRGKSPSDFLNINDMGVQ